MRRGEDVVQDMAVVSVNGKDSACAQQGLKLFIVNKKTHRRD